MYDKSIYNWDNYCHISCYINIYTLESFCFKYNVTVTKDVKNGKSINIKNVRLEKILQIMAIINNTLILKMYKQAKCGISSNTMIK